MLRLLLVSYQKNWRMQQPKKGRQASPQQQNTPQTGTPQQNTPVQPSEMGGGFVVSSFFSFIVLLVTT